MKQRRNVGGLQARLNELWPDEVQDALKRERAGAEILLSEQLWLMSLVFGALRESVAEGAQIEQPSGRLQVRIVGAEMQVYRVGTGDPEYLGIIRRK